MSLPGKLLLHLFHAPLGRLRDSVREGGPWGARRTEAGRAEMEAAAAGLPALELPPAPAGHVVHLMTGARFWYQTAFCLHSLALHSNCAVGAEIYDDGTLAPSHRDHLSRLGLPLRFHDSGELRARLEDLLPAARYPFLRDRWTHYPNIRKLIDVHLGSAGWKLVIDSDLLFFRRPDLLLDWLSAPCRPLHAIDCEESYGYSRPLMERLAGARPPVAANVGLCGLRSDEIGWDRLELWCRELITRERSHYFLEQALVAMLVAGRECVVAPAVDYVTGPREPEASACRAVMHHYVAGSKRWYFRQNWRSLVSS
jgi:hypothetical protein